MQQISKFIRLKISNLDKRVRRIKQFINWEKIHKILLIVDVDTLDINQIPENIEPLNSKDVKVIIVSSDPDYAQNDKFYFALKKQFLFFKYLKTTDIQEIIDNSYDAALAYSNGELWAVALLLAQTKAKLRISNAQELANISDITIMPKNNSLTGFISQTIKYLQTIKPSENAQ